MVGYIGYQGYIYAQGFLPNGTVLVPEFQVSSLNSLPSSQIQISNSLDNIGFIISYVSSSDFQSGGIGPFSA